MHCVCEPQSETSALCTMKYTTHPSVTSSLEYSGRVFTGVRTSWQNHTKSDGIQHSSTRTFICHRLLFVCNFQIYAVECQRAIQHDPLHFFYVAVYERATSHDRCEFVFPLGLALIIHTRKHVCHISLRHPRVDTDNHARNERRRFLKNEQKSYIVELLLASCKASYENITTLLRLS